MVSRTIDPAALGALRATTSVLLGNSWESIALLEEQVRRDLGTYSLARELQARLGPFDRQCQIALDASRGLLHGIGFLAEKDLLADAPYWGRWWARTMQGRVSLDEHNLNPSQDSFYEYADSDWFAALRTGDGDQSYGPYIDYNGTNDYTLTLARAVRSGGEFLGAVAGDIPIAALERELESPMRQLGRPGVVINSENRVILSTTADWSVGALFRRAAEIPVEMHKLSAWKFVAT